jgi:3-oxoisoapionate kinase
LKTNQNILLAFYGDDLTGSTDALEFISSAGAKAVLFLEVPTQDLLDKFPGLQAFGVAGLTRSLPPEEMEVVLLPAFKRLKETGASHVHYKICSTFDSSPQTGSIGKAIDCGAIIFGNKFIPVLGGMPTLGRYCVFGNLFAKMGIGSNGNIFRLDRHPSMSKHPVTPAYESDLRLHLSSQTTRAIGLIDVIQLDQPLSKWAEVGSEDEVVLLDALTESHLDKIGEWLAKHQQEAKQLFSVGSSGIEKALGHYWNNEGLIHETKPWQEFDEVEPLLVLSGSCSPVSRKQISYAVSHGFTALPLEWKDHQPYIDTKRILDCLKKKKSVIVHTGNIEAVPQATSASILGTALGKIAKDVCEEIRIRRIAVAGGDTSSYAGRAMEIDGLEMIFPFVNGAPVCRAYSKNKNIDGMQVNFKGGQVGGEDYFVQLKKGKKQP